MEDQAGDESLLYDPKRLLLGMAQEYSGVELLQMIATRLSRLPRGQFEADNIRAALKAADGRVAGPGGAAQRLGLKPLTLESRIRAIGIRLSGPATSVEDT
jgi:transcriptional regulator with GAF, ATPase, and Fis domain